jgi:hypothetical protein
MYARFYPRIPYSGGIASFGLAALALAGLALWRWRAPTRPWLLLAGVGLLLCLGPTLHLNGADLGLPLPYRLFRLIPFMDASRVPAAFLKWLLLALAVLLAFGLRRAAALAGRGRRGSVAVAALAGVLAVEGLAAPLNLPDRPAVSACYRLLATDPRPGALLDLPVIDANEPMYYQTFHGRTVAGGDLSRDNPYGFLQSTPVVAQLARAEAALPDDIFRIEAGARARELLAGWGIRWIALRTGDAGADLPRYTAALDHLLGRTPPDCDQDGMRLWHIDAEPGPTVLSVGKGWNEPEIWDAGSRVRWLIEEGRLNVFAPAAGPARLSFAVTSRLRQRTVEVWVGNDRQTRFDAVPGPREPVDLTLTLPAGRTVVHLRSIDPPEPGDGRDRRLLSVAVSDVQLSAATAGHAAPGDP